MMKGFTPEMQRRQRIENIKASIVAAIEQNVELDEDKFLMQIQLQYGVREHVAKDYLRIAKGTI